MALKSETKFPSRRTYVLKVRGDATPEALTGRLENVVTGRQRDFTTAIELAESLASDIREGEPGPASDETGRQP